MGTTNNKLRSTWQGEGSNPQIFAGVTLKYLFRESSPPRLRHLVSILKLCSQVGDMYFVTLAIGV